MGRIFNELPSQDSIMVYIGQSEKFINTLTLNLGTNVPLYIFDPIFSAFEEVVPQIVKRKVMQRYANVEKVRSDDTKVIGILIGSVVVDNYMPLINNIKLSAARAGKKYYEVLIGKLNEPKLKNFQFVSSIVLTELDRSLCVRELPRDFADRLQGVQHFSCHPARVLHGS